MPAEMEAYGPDDRLGPDVDEVLVVEGALGEEQAGAGAHAAEALPPGVAGADRPEVGRALPGGVHQSGQGAPQRCREGAGPTHARMVGGAGHPLVTDPRPCVQRGGRGKLAPCRPSHRTVAPTACRSRRSARSTAANSCSSPRSERPASWAPPASARVISKQRCPAKAKHRTTGRAAVVDKKLPSGVSVPTAPWLIAENAKPGTLNWICNHNQPEHALEGFASQVSAVPGDDVAVFVNTTAQRRPGAGLPDGLLPGPRWPAHRPDRLRPGRRSRPRPWSRPASAR